MSEIANLTAQIQQLATTIAQLQGVQQAATSNVPRDDANYSQLYKDGTVKLKPFGKAPVSVKKAAHNAARQHQKRVGKDAPNYTLVYKEAYDCHCESSGYRGKYRTRDAKKAAQTKAEACL